MAEKRTINCRDCGGEYETIRRNTKYCSRCRLLRDLHFLGDKTHECWICKHSFAPIERHDVGCADCTYHPQNYGEAECIFCSETKLRVRRDVPVCHECARIPEHRGKLIGLLKKGQLARIKVNREEVTPI